MTLSTPKDNDSLVIYLIIFLIQACLFCTILTLAMATITIAVSWFALKDTMAVNPFKVKILLPSNCLVTLWTGKQMANS